MFKLDNNFLVELGLGSLPAEEKNKMLAHIYETLEMRVGMRLAEKMSNEQLDEFESFINNNDEAGALKWLESNFPNYKQVVAEELEKLKSEIKQVAPQIVGQAQAMPSQTATSSVDPLPQQAPMSPPPQAPMQPQPQVPQMQNNFGMPPQQPLMQSAMQQPPMMDPTQSQFQQPLPPPPMPLDPLPQQAPMSPPPQAPMQPQPQVPQMQNNFGMPPQQPLMQSAMQQPPMMDPTQSQFQQPLPPQLPGSVPATPPVEYQQFVNQQPVMGAQYGYQPMMDQMNGNGAYGQEPPTTAPQSEYIQQQGQVGVQQPQQPFPPVNEFPVDPAPVYVPPPLEGETELHHQDSEARYSQANQLETTQPQQPATEQTSTPLQFQPPVTPPKQPWQPPA